MNQANLVINNIDWLITVDEQRRVLRDAAIAIVDGRFAAIGKTAEISGQWNAAESIDASGAVATPGFVDNHLHSSFQLARGLADEANAQSFLFEHMYPYEGSMTSEDVAASAAFAAMQLLRCGVTCFIDPGNYHPEASVNAVAATGMRMVTSRSTFDKTKSVMGLLPEKMIESTEACLEAAEAVLEKYSGEDDGRISASACFRGLNNASDELITGLRSLAEKYDTFLQTHACFAYSTHDSSIAQCGKPEIERLESLGVLDDRMLLVHSGWLEPHEVALLAKRKPTLVAAPSSSMHNGYGNIVMGKLPELLALGVNVSLASDHACSGITDIIQEMLLVAGGYKEARINPRVMPPETAIEMATINGAKGARLDSKVGSVEIGKQADLVLFDTTFPEWQPLYNPVSNLVYSATGSSVKHVLVGGHTVVQDGHLTLADENEILRGVTAGAQRITARLDMDKIIKLQWPVE